MQSDDPRYEPTYTIAETARYLHLPKSTLRAWVIGQRYHVALGWRRFRPILKPAAHPVRNEASLSFINIVEAHVLKALRRTHKVQLEKVRKAVEYLSETTGSENPLAEERFRTDGIDLFVNRYGLLISASEGGQVVIREAIEMYLGRVVHERGSAVKLYPFTSTMEPESEPRIIAINPLIASGRPVIDGTGIPYHVLAERWQAGETIASIARDYGQSPEHIEEALRYQFAA